MDLPTDLSYTNEHEWIKIEKDIAIIGITDFAQSELGDIVFVELPNIGDIFKKKDIFGTIEAVKTLADLYIPISGEIIQVNDVIDGMPELINSDPYDKGWIVKIKISNKTEVGELLTSSQYINLIK